MGGIYFFFRKIGGVFVLVFWVCCWNGEIGEVLL